MAQVTSEFNEYVGISNDTYTDGKQTVITVAIPEFHPLEKRDLGEIKVYKCETNDEIGHTNGSCQLQSSKTVVCTYFGNDGNHFIPCVHRGERVRVFNYAGTEQYYWKEWGRDMGLHKHERLRWFAMDKKKNGDHWSTDVKYQALPDQSDKFNDDGGASFKDEYTYSDVTDANTYLIEINTLPGEKNIRIHTGIEDGEPFAYDISIWPLAGVLEISDNKDGGGCFDGIGNCPCHMDTGNNIRLNSKENWWHIRNCDDSVIDVKKENITIGCKDTISLIAGQKILMRSGMYYGLNAPMQAINGTEQTTTMSDSVNTHAPNQSYSGDNIVHAFNTGVDSYTGKYGRRAGYVFIQAPVTDAIGDFNITGNINQSGNYVQKGNFNQTGKSTISVECTINNIAFTKHVHNCPGTGAPTSPPH